jgi:hypothetical protein
VDQKQGHEGTYVYGVVPSDRLPVITAPGVEAPAGDVRWVVLGGLAALVSDVPTVPVTASRANLNAHAAVLQAAAEGSTILPMRFGFVMADDDEVRVRLLEERRADLERLLAQIKGRVEFGLRVYYIEDVLLKEIVSENREIARLRETSRSLPGDAGYYQRIRLGELVVEAMGAKRVRDAGEILGHLKPLAVATEREDDIPERMVLKVAFLLDETRLSGFESAVETLAGRNSERMHFKLLGPLPPYNFADLTPRAEAGVG